MPSQEGGGQRLLGRFVISDQRLHPPAHPPGLPESPPSDWFNWIKMTPIIGSSWGPVRSPNDPYLTPFVAMVSLFPRRRSIWNGLPWPRHKRFSPIPRWTQQPADIMRVTERLHFSQMCGKLSVRRLCMATSFHPFFHSGFPRGAGAGGADEAHLCEMLCIWYLSHFRRWFILDVKLRRWKSALHQCSAWDKKGKS